MIKTFFVLFFSRSCLGILVVTMIVLLSREVQLTAIISTSLKNHHAPAVELADKLSQTNALNIKLSKHIPVVHDGSAEVRHIGFLKVHKAGSSTMQNIFFRFGLKRNLTFLIPATGNYFISNDSVMPVKPGNHYDMLAVHSVYSKASFDQMLPLDKINIAIIREPLELMISAAYYYRDVFHNGYLRNIPNETFIKELVMQANKFDPGPFSRTRNSMGRDFGFNATTGEGDTKTILEKLNSLDKEFKLVLVMERFEESMVLMKRYLNWKMSDILFLQANHHKHSPVVKLTEKEKKKHKSTCFMDYAIYDFFTNIYRHKVKAEGPLFHNEVKQFQAVLKQVRSFCDQNTVDNLEVTASSWNQDFMVTKSDCALMKLQEIKFLNNLRTRHKLMNGIR